MRPCSVFSLILISSVCLSVTQVVLVQNAEAPGVLVVSPVGRFFVYGPDDTPRSLFLKDANNITQVTFSSFHMTGAKEGSNVEAVLIPANSTVACCGAEGQKYLCISADSNSVADPAQYKTVMDNGPRSFEIVSTNVYELVISNCGDTVNATVSGEVTVQSTYGYLSGIDVYKLPLYGWSSILLCCLLTIWGARCISYWSQLIQIHYLLSFTLITGVLESIVWFLYFSFLNSDGVKSSFLLFCAVLCTVLKNIVSLVVVLVASMGFGVTCDSLSPSTVTKIKATVGVYVILDGIRQLVIQCRVTQELAMGVVIVCLLPLAIVNTIVFLWIFNSLTQTTEGLMNEKQQSKLAVFQNFWTLLVATFVTAAVVCTIQIFVMSKDFTTMWENDWWFTDAVPLLLYTIILIGMLWLWVPNKNSQGYAYSSQVPTFDEETLGKPNEWDIPEDREIQIWGDEMSLDDTDSDGGNRRRTPLPPKADNPLGEVTTFGGKQ